jgi:hypothetical protein
MYRTELKTNSHKLVGNAAPRNHEEPLALSTGMRMTETEHDYEHEKTPTAHNNASYILIAADCSLHPTAL